MLYTVADKISIKDLADNEKKFHSNKQNELLIKCILKNSSIYFEQIKCNCSYDKGVILYSFSFLNLTKQIKNLNNI